MLVVFILSLYNLYKIFNEYNNNNTYKEVSNIVKIKEEFPIGSQEYANLKEINEENFIPVIVKEKKDLWEALKLMLSKELKEE